MISSIINKISHWWQGEWQEPTMEEIFEHDNPPDKYKHHWSAKITRAIWFFWKKHWSILSLIIIGILTIATMLFTHFGNKTISNQTQIEQPKNQHFYAHI